MSFSFWRRRGIIFENYYYFSASVPTVVGKLSALPSGGKLSLLLSCVFRTESHNIVDIARLGHSNQASWATYFLDALSV